MHVTHFKIMSYVHQLLPVIRYNICNIAYEENEIMKLKEAPNLKH